MKKLLLAAAAAAAPSVACAQDVVANFDPFKERDAQRSAVGEGRTVLIDFNQPFDLAGKAVFCEETTPGSKQFKPKGNGRFELSKEIKFEKEELDAPRRTRRVVVQKGGEVSGWGASLDAKKRKLVEVSTYESARANAPASLNADQVKLANEMMILAGGKAGDYACYISSVSELTTQLIVDQETKFSAATPAIFVVAAKLTFLRQASNIQRDPWATVIMTPFKLAGLSAPTAEPVAGAVFAADALKNASAEEQAAADRISEVAQENLIVEKRAADAGVNFSASVKDKFDRLTEEELSEIRTVQ